MKITKYLLVCSSLLAFTFLFSKTSNAEFVSNEITNTIDSDSAGANTCTLYVKTSYGSAAKSIRVATDVSGGISCAGGRSFYTNSDGMVTLEWVSGCYLRTVFVDGREYDVDYKDGGTYHLTMK